MPAIQMRRVPYTRLKHVHNVSRKTSSHGQSITPVVAPSINISRSLANVRSTETSCPEFFYGSSLPKLNIGGEVRPDDVHPPDPRTLRLGKSKFAEILFGDKRRRCKFIAEVIKNSYSNSS